MVNMIWTVWHGSLNYGFISQIWMNLKNLLTRNSWNYTLEYLWNIRNCWKMDVLLLIWFFSISALPFSTLQFFPKFVLAPFNEIFIDTFSFEKFLRSNRLLVKWWFFKNDNCQNCQGYFRIFYSKHLKYHINLYSAMSERLNLFHRRKNYQSKMAVSMLVINVNDSENFVGSNFDNKILKTNICHQFRSRKHHLWYRRNIQIDFKHLPNFFFQSLLSFIWIFEVLYIAWIYSEGIWVV